MKMIRFPMKILFVVLSFSPMVLASAPVWAQTADQPQVMGMNHDGLMMPRMNAAEGRMLFGSKGCVMCHAVNGIGGEDAAALDAASMPMPMNPFDFAAKMWLGAPAMIAMQEDEMGGQIEFTGAELANIIAFVHDSDEQSRFTMADIPPEIAARLKAMAEGEGN